MEVTSRNKKKDKWRHDIIDWFVSHKELTNQKRVTPRSPESHHFLSFLWPVSFEYFSPLNPIFLAEFFNPEQLYSHHTWLIRDGLIPLLWFFKMSPTPGKFKGQIFVSEELTPYVPNAWRPQTGSYKLESKPYVKGSAKKILFSGLITEIFCSLKHLEKELDRVVEIVGEAELAKMEKLCFFVGKHFGYGVEGRQEVQTEYFLKIFKRVGLKNVTAVNWNNIQGINSFEDTVLHEFNEKLLCADSFIEHSLLQKGARFLDSPTKSNQTGEVIALSPHHGMRLHRKIGGTCILEDRQADLKKAEAYFTKIHEAMRSEANLNMPWPQWFNAWAKVATRTKKSDGLELSN